MKDKKPYVGEPMKSLAKDSRLEFIEALSKAQLQFKPVSKNSDNPFFRSKYSTYEEVWASVGKPLNENGFAVMHKTYIENGHFLLATILMHKGGHEEISEHEIVPENKNNMQGKGSAETYSKRYNLVALTAVPVGGDDDDGNAACKPADQEDQKKLALKLFSKLTDTEASDCTKWLDTAFGTHIIKDLKPDQLKDMVLKLEARERQKAQQKERNEKVNNS